MTSAMPTWPPQPPQPPPAAPDVFLVLQTIVTQQGAIQTDMSALRADVSKALTRIEVIDSRNQNADGLHRDYESRLRLLERFRWTLGGVSLVGGFLSGFLGYLLGHVVH